MYAFDDQVQGVNCFHIDPILGSFMYRLLDVGADIGVQWTLYTTNIDTNLYTDLFRVVKSEKEKIFGHFLF